MSGASVSGASASGASASGAEADGLARALRRLLDAVVVTEVDPGELRAVTTEVDRLTQRLGEQRRDGPPLPDEDGLRRGYRPYNPVVGTANPLAPPLSIRVLEDRSVLGDVTMRPIHEGPPGAVHGGWVASLLDQLLGHANAAAGVIGMTGELTVTYRRPTPHSVPLTLRARTDTVEGRRVTASGEIVADGVVTAQARGLFVQPSAERLRALHAEIAERRAAG